MRSLTPALVAMLALTACSVPGGPAPSLAPRPAEAIDPRVPVAGATAAGQASPALAARLAELVSQARAGDSAFRDAVLEAERLLEAAGDRQGEGWVAAQQRVSVAVAARAPTTRALADIDAIAASAIAEQGGIGAANLIVIEAAAAEVAEIDRAQAARLELLQARLGG